MLHDTESAEGTEFLNTGLAEVTERKTQGKCEPR